MNWESSHRNDEIGKDVINFMRAPRLRAPPGYGGAVRCFSEIKVLDPPRGRPAGGGGNYHNWGYGGLNPHYSRRRGRNSAESFWSVSNELLIMYTP
jgi:hypothetical protein